MVSCNTACAHRPATELEDWHSRTPAAILPPVPPSRIRGSYRKPVHPEASGTLNNLIHPHSELRFVSPAIGYGVFATRLIPKGSITWAGDKLDQIITDAQLKALPGMLSRQVLRYSYLNGRGDRILCWDHGRFVNHSCAAACLSPGFDFEIAVRDIAPGEEITDDYGTLNLEEPFPCCCDAPRCRGLVLPDDPLRHAAEWDRLIADAFPEIARVEQPLWDLVQEKTAVKQVLAGELKLPSVLIHYLGARHL